MNSNNQVTFKLNPIRIGYNFVFLLILCSIIGILASSLTSLLILWVIAILVGYGKIFYGGLIYKIIYFPETNKIEVSLFERFSIRKHCFIKGEYSFEFTREYVARGTFRWVFIINNSTKIPLKINIDPSGWKEADLIKLKELTANS